MDSPPTRFESPPPRFSEGGSLSTPGTPRFTEQFNASPPYQQYQNFEGHDTGVSQHVANQETKLPLKDRPHSPSELVSPMPEVVRGDHEEKEVVIPPFQPQPYERPVEEQRRQRKRICGIPFLWFWVIVAAVLVLAVGLGVGLGVGLSNKADSPSDDPSNTQANTDYMIGGAIDPQYFSEEGAFNGSGIALASQSFADDLAEGTQGRLVVYYQHWSGDIRYQQLTNSGSWEGGDVSTVVAQDAKNSTPLSAVAYVLGDENVWHVFYIDQNNTLKQRSNSNKTNLWVDGPINDLNVKPFDADMVGMQACYYGSNYGDSDYVHTPLPNEDSSANITSEVGMHMWYASGVNTFEQYGWRAGDDAWDYQKTWTDMNGHAGVGCYSWGPGTVTYVMFVNSNNTVEFWWRDTNTNLTGTAEHPINEWTNATQLSIPNVQPATSLGYTNVFYAQLEDLYFHGFNITWDAENTTISGDSIQVDGAPGLPGSHLSVTAIPNSSGGDNLLVFFQTNGTDIAEYTRDIVAGQWAQVNIEIPN